MTTFFVAVGGGELWRLVFRPTRAGQATTFELTERRGSGSIGRHRPRGGKLQPLTNQVIVSGSWE